MRKYKIIVACGTAIATSTHVALKVEELLQKRGKEVNIVQCRVQEIPSFLDGASVVISTTIVPFDLDIPVIDGIPFLTGVGIKEVINKIDDVLEKEADNSQKQ
ncbi:MAG TPA: PTS sugar transporter subunit IIB [Anaerolineae bacterium]|nr:PTS sugar transporter subunit IIB [Anaerolineae bacterium]